jgi:hypothetical protein
LSHWIGRAGTVRQRRTGLGHIFNAKTFK